MIEASSHHEVSAGVTILFGLLLAGMILCLALEEKIHAKKSVITGTFAVICVLLAEFFGILPIGPIENVFHEKIKMPVYITGIDWEVIAIIVGTGLFVDVTTNSGLFSWIALKVTKLSKGDPLKLLSYYGVLTVLFSAFLSNVTAMIIIGSLTSVSLRKLEKSQFLLGFLLVEGFLTNIGGLLTLISSVPNIIIGNTARITFMTFLLNAAPYVVVASLATIWLGAKLFKIQSLKTDQEVAEAAALVSSFDETDGISSKPFFYGSAISFILLILLFATASGLPYIKDLGLGYIALSFGLISLWAYKSQVEKFFSGLDWDLIWFFLTLFAVINTMEHALVLKSIGNGIEQVIQMGELVGTTGLLWLSALASAVTDNIPLAAVLAKILSGGSSPTPSDSPLWWSVIFGANLGGNITPIGSASTVVAVTIMQKNKLAISFGSFVKHATPFAVMQLILASAYLLLFF